MVDRNDCVDEILRGIRDRRGRKYVEPRPTTAPLEIPG